MTEPARAPRATLLWQDLLIMCGESLPLIQGVCSPPPPTPGGARHEFMFFVASSFAFVVLAGLAAALGLGILLFAVPVQGRHVEASASAAGTCHRWQGA